MNKKRFFSAVVSVLFLCLFMVSSVSAAGSVGGRPLNPNDPEHGNWFVYDLKPGESRNDVLLVMNSSSQEWIAEIYPSDVIASSSGGFALKQKVEKMTDVGQWIKMSKSRFPIKPGERVEVPFTISVPLGSNPESAGAIMIEKHPLHEEKTASIGGSGVKLSTRSGVRVYNKPGSHFQEMTIARATAPVAAPSPGRLVASTPAVARPVNTPALLRADLLAKSSTKSAVVDAPKPVAKKVTSPPKGMFGGALLSADLMSASKMEDVNKDGVKAAEERAIISTPRGFFRVGDSDKNEKSGSSESSDATIQNEKDSGISESNGGPSPILTVPASEVIVETEPATKKTEKVHVEVADVDAPSHVISENEPTVETKPVENNVAEEIKVVVEKKVEEVPVVKTKPVESDVAEKTKAVAEKKVEEVSVIADESPSATELKTEGKAVASDEPVVVVEKMKSEPVPEPFKKVPALKLKPVDVDMEFPEAEGKKKITPEEMYARIHELEEKETAPAKQEKDLKASAPTSVVVEEKLSLLESIVDKVMGFVFNFMR